MTPRQTRAAVGVAAVLLFVATSGRAQVKDWPSERPPRPLQAHSVKFPPYAVKTLPNGLQVLAVSHHEQPAVSLRLIVRAGGAQDPDAKPGVASLAAGLLDQGTATRSAEQIADTIDSIGGALGTGSGLDLTFINAVVMKDSLNVALDLVADLAQHPAFASDEIERQRQQAVSGLKVSYDDPDYLANMVFDRLVYGFHPYGRPQAGTPATLAGISREDLVAFHRKWFGANNAILAIVGDVNSDEAFAGAERAFGSWSRAQAEAPRPVDPPPSTRRLIVIDRPRAVQTEIRVGNLGISRRNPDYMPLDLAVKILGGEGANRLHRVLRTERGLTYGASADMNAWKQTGDIVAGTSTRSATTGETLRLMVDEIWKLLRDRVSERELGDAQAYLTGSFPVTIETPSQIALQVLNAVFYGLDLNDLQTYRERVNAVGVDDVQRVAREYLHPDRLTIVLVGDASSIAKQLPGAGFDKFERIPVADLDLSAADLRRKGAAAVGGELRPVSLQVDAPAPAARAIVDRAIAAKGGVARLQAIRTARYEATTEVQTPDGARAISMVTSIEYPDRFRIDANTPDGKLVQIYADGHYWVQDARGVTEAPLIVRDQIHGSVQRDVVRLLLRAAQGRVEARGAASDDASVLAVTLTADGLSPVTLFIDRQTGLILKEQYRNGDDTDVTEEQYSDYRAVDGVEVAFHAVIRRPGAFVVARAVKDVRFNVPLESRLFAKPS